MLPENFRDGANAGENPNAIGVPTNAGQLHSHGLEFWAGAGGLTLVANYDRTYSSSIYQFAFNDLNAAAILAGHLFPANYIPNFTATASYEFAFDRRRARVTPMLSYESGYPYGNGTMIWEIVHGVPVEVPNDNYVNPGLQLLLSAESGAAVQRARRIPISRRWERAKAPIRTRCARRRRRSHRCTPSTISRRT